jgi:hypothetical protein
MERFKVGTPGKYSNPSLSNLTKAKKKNCYGGNREKEQWWK